MRNALSWLVFASFALIAPPQAQAQWWNPLAPKTYEDCVLKGMKGVSGDTAAMSVMGACRKKFPVKEDTCRFYRALTEDEGRKVTRGSVSRTPPSVSVDIYNGSNVTLYKVAIETTIRGVKREYEGSLFPIAPKAAGKVYVTLLDEEALHNSEKKKLRFFNLQTCRF